MFSAHGFYSNRCYMSMTHEKNPETVTSQTNPGIPKICHHMENSYQLHNIVPGAAVKQLYP